MNRLGWVNFKPGSDMDAALKLLNENRVNGIHQLNMHRSDAPSNSRMRTAPGLCNDAERMRKDLEQICQLVAAMEAECDDGRASAALAVRIEAMRAEARASVTEGDDEALDAAQALVVRHSLARLRPRVRRSASCAISMTQNRLADSLRTDARSTCISRCCAMSSRRATTAWSSATSPRS